MQEREAKNQRCVPVPERHIDTELTGAAELLEEMKDSLDRIGRESLAEDMQATLWNTVFYISRGEAAWQIKNDNVEEYVTKTMTKLSHWKAVRAFFQMLIAKLTVTPGGLQKDKNDCSKFALELAKHAFPTVAKLFTFMPDMGQQDPDAIRQFEFGGGWNDAGPHITSLGQATFSAGISPDVKI